jgi:hypothetical protein
MIRHILFFVLYLAVTLNAWAGVVGKVAGKITDAESGDAIIGAAVMIEGTSLGAAADINGYYFIINVPPGMVNVRVSAIGYTPKTVQGIQVISDQTSTVDFVLAPQSLQGEEVVIVAERKLVETDRTFSTSTVSAQDIGALPVTNLTQVIELQAGVVDGHFRGGRSNEVLYLVDGVSVTDVYDNSQGTQVDNHAVEELQVISGTFNAEYGQAMSGVVNIVTKEGGSTYHGSLQGESGDYISDHKDIFLGINKVSPAAIQDYSGSLDGPVPKIPKLHFYATGRYLDDSGWLYGEQRWRVINPNILDSTGIERLSDPGLAEMNYNFERWGNLKLNYDLTSKIKLNYTTLLSNRAYRDYSHDWKYYPVGDLRRYREGRTNILKMNHALSSNMFYELGVNNTFTEYHHYVYKDAFDPRYLDPRYDEANPPYTLNFAGNNLNRFRRWTNTNELLGQLSWQANKLHLLKFGFDAKQHELFYEDINLVPRDLLGTTFDPVIEPISSPSHDLYKNNPSEYAAYVQDKFEVSSLIINAGLRVDYFEPDGRYPADPKDPNVYSPLLPERAAQPLSVRESYWWKKATAKSQVSPRIGIAYPMSDKGVFHFSYGHFVQRPTFERMYANPEWELESGVGLNTVMGNPNLKMEETVSYEFGFQQQVAENVALQTTIFSRDIRNLVATDRIVETYSSGTKYSQYVNRSFGEVKGITLSFDKRYASNFSAFLDYTYQIAEGNASDPQSTFNDLRGNNPRQPEEQLVPLDWDRRHTINAGVSYSTPGRSNWGGTLVGKYGSGLPYSPADNGIRTGFENSGRRPAFRNADLTAFRSIPFGGDRTPQKVVIMLTVLNLFDTKNEDNVYATTGRAGYNYDPGAVEVPEINTLKEVFNNPSYYSRPRMVKVGVRYEF